MNNVHVSDTARDFISRLIEAAVVRDGVVGVAGCHTKRVVEGIRQLTRLSKMAAFAEGRAFVAPEDIQSMAQFVIPYLRGDTLARELLEETPIIQKR